jgi:hypothetical protein
VPYDLCSINIGSTPQVARVPGALEHAVPVKPITRFNERWLALLQRVRQHAGRTVIAVVGGGAGGVELTLAMQHRLGNELKALGRDPRELEFHLFTRDRELLQTHNPKVRRRFTRVLVDRRVNIHTDTDVQQVGPGQLTTQRGTVVAGGRDRLGHAGRWRRLAARHRSGAGRQRLCARQRPAAEHHRPEHLCGRGHHCFWSTPAGKSRRVCGAHGSAPGRQPARGVHRPGAASPIGRNATGWP